MIVVDLSMYKGDITIPTKLLKKECSYRDDNNKKCRKNGYYGINGKWYCYNHNRQLEIEHMIRIGY